MIGSRNTSLRISQILEVDWDSKKLGIILIVGTCCIALKVFTFSKNMKLNKKKVNIKRERKRYKNHS